jgi:cobalt/nickel transport system permease protein
MHLIDRVAHTNRWSARHPGDKLLLGGGLLILSLVLPPIPGAILVLIAAVTVTVAGARVPAGDYLRVLIPPAAFMVSGAAVLAMSVRLDGGGPAVAFSPQGALTAIDVSLRALAATASLLLIILTTPVSEFLGLLRKIRVPAAIVDVTLLVYRFTMVAAEVADRTRISQASRMGYTGFRRSLRSAGLLAASLLPRVLDKAARMETGLAARAYDGDLRVLSPLAAPSRRFALGSVALQGAILAVSLGWLAAGLARAAP